MRAKTLICLALAMAPQPGVAAHLERVPAEPLPQFQFIQLDQKSAQTIGAWMPAKVPGDVMSDLVRAGKLKPPYQDFNSREALWVNDYDWLYQTDFPADLKPDERLWVLFHGIDYQSSGFLNGQKVFDHTGMFSRIFIDATPFLKKDGPNRLQVKLFGLKNRWHSKQYQVNQFLEQLARRKYLKTQMSFGWDIAVELINAGIWDQVEMFKTGPAMISDLGIKTKNFGEASLDLSLDSKQSANAVLRIAVSPENFGDGKPVLKQNFPLDLKAGAFFYNLQFIIHNPLLWWTPELGNPNLYRLQADLVINGKSSDSVEETFGFREIAWEQNPGAPEGWRWVCRLNGKRIYLRGANWVPPDALPGQLTDQKYEKLIALARGANLNIFRIWGGGNRERDIFYDLADRAGIMLWQEFPFACIYVPGYPTDKKYLDLAGQEVSEIVRALRNHPSVVIYSGGNEFNADANQPVVDRMRKAVGELDGTRRFIKASPAEGDGHNWVVWHQKGNLRDYFADEHALMSEFGIQAFPSLQTLQKYLSPELLWPIGEVYKHHDLEYGKILKYADAIPHADNLEGLITASQKMQGYYYQRAIEHWRIRKYRYSGSLFWMFDEPWPSVVGSVADYELNPKAAYYRIQESYNPLLIAADLEVRSWKPGEDFSTELYLVNDYDRKFAALKISALISGQPLGEWTADAEPDSSVRIATFKTRLPAGSPLILELVAKDGDKMVSHNLYDLEICDEKASNPFNRSLEKLSKKLMAGEKGD